LEVTFFIRGGVFSSRWSYLQRVNRKQRGKYWWHYLASLLQMLICWRKFQQRFQKSLPRYILI